MRLTKAQMRESWERDRKNMRLRYGIAGGAALLAFAFCLCFRYNAYFYPEKFVLSENLKSYVLALRLLFARVTGGALFEQKTAAIEALGSIVYYGALARLRITLVAFVSGAALSIAGAIFQTAYRNPMASPNMIGAAAGVDLGNVLVVTLCSAQAYENILLRYRYCYGLTAVCMGLVFLLGRLGGRGRKEYSVLEMVMAGAVVSQIIRVFSMYLMYELPEEDLLLYQEISLGTYPDTSAVSMAVFFGVMLISVVPVVLMRWRLNVLGMDALEAASVGVSAGRMRVIAQICGVLMVNCSMIHCGEIGMLSLVIPYVVRQRFGADFRQQCLLSALIGGTLLMLCNLAASFFYVADAPLPVTFLIELVLVPAFLFILARNRRGTDEI